MSIGRTCMTDLLQNCDCSSVAETRKSLSATVSVSLRKYFRTIGSINSWIPLDAVTWTKLRWSIASWLNVIAGVNGNPMTELPLSPAWPGGRPAAATIDYSNKVICGIRPKVHMTQTIVNITYVIYPKLIQDSGTTMQAHDCGIRIISR